MYVCMYINTCTLTLFLQKIRETNLGIYLKEIEIVDLTKYFFGESISVILQDFREISEIYVFHYFTLQHVFTIFFFE